MSMDGGAIMQFQKLIRILGTATEGRYIGGVRDTSAPTDVQTIL